MFIALHCIAREFHIVLVSNTTSARLFTLFGENVVCILLIGHTSCFRWWSDKQKNKTHYWQWLSFTDNCVKYFGFVCAWELPTKLVYAHEFVFNLVLMLTYLECSKWVTVCMMLVICINMPKPFYITLSKHMTLSKDAFGSNATCIILKTSYSTINTLYTDADYRPLISQLHIHISALLYRKKV